MNVVGRGAMLLATSLLAVRLRWSEVKHLCHFLVFSTLLITILAIAAYTSQGTGTTLLMLWVSTALLTSGGV